MQHQQIHTCKYILVLWSNKKATWDQKYSFSRLSFSSLDNFYDLFMTWK